MGGKIRDLLSQFLTSIHVGAQGLRDVDRPVCPLMIFQKWNENARRCDSCVIERMAELQTATRVAIPYIGSPGLEIQ